MGILQLQMHPLITISLFLLVMNHHMLGASSSSSDPFSDALLSLKSEFIDQSNALSNWLLPPGIPPSSTLIHACSWTGIKCSPDSSQILSIDLSGKNLGGSLSGNHFSVFVDLVSLNISHNSFSGPLPPGIFNLTSLTSLDISRNNFSALFPTGIPRLKNLQVLDAFSNSFSGPLPPDISQIETLKVVNFAGSYFSGPIPSEYGSFRALEYLHLAGNFLSGNLPPELGNLGTLSHMEIGYNSYQGGIPWQFGNMSGLQYLDIADANISGPIPPQIGNLTNLESLFLFKNELNGNIPEELSTISTLKSLDLSDNLLSGPIPANLSELKSLRLLSLMFNDLTGTVPPGIARLPQLDTLLIWSNYLTGSLPEDLGRNSKLQHLDVSTNYFVGSIPPAICSGKELLRLILFSNNFTGGLHPSMSNCSSLVRLRIEDNSFSGEISLPFADLPNLSYADFSRNKFTGGIPPDINKASSLEYLNLSYNPLGGVMPLKKWSMPNLQNFSLISCGVSGSVPEVEGCRSVSVIELRMNNFSGKIPDSLSNCKELVKIDLANNSLTGTIPGNLASLPNLSVLDLSHNSFTGPIPPAFGTSPALKLVNVSYNDLTGTIPSSKAFKMMDQSAFIGNPKLCGAPLRGCHHGISSGFELGSRRAQKLAWILILCAAVVLFLVAAAFGILYFDRVSKCRWKMVAFDGLPQFTAKDVLRSFNYAEALETLSFPPDSVSKVVLPTGITVSAKKVEWEGKDMKAMLQVLSRIGNARHKNLTRLLGICYNNRLAYLLYDYMSNGTLAEKIRSPIMDWEAKCKIITGVAKALCYLHHHCYPAIPHGNFKSSNVLFDENMEPHLAEYGLKLIIESRNGHGQAKLGRKTGGAGTSTRDEVSMDVYNFGEMILEVLTNGGMRNASEIDGIKEQKQVAAVIREVTGGNDNGNAGAAMKPAIELALLCITSRPSMQEVLKLMQGCWELEEKDKPICP